MKTNIGVNGVKQLPSVSTQSRFASLNRRPRSMHRETRNKENGSLRPKSKMSDVLKMQIKKRRNQQKMEDRLIEMTINKIQNENAYEYLIKMGEANEICQNLGLNITYRVFNSANGTIKCHIYELNQFKKCLNLDDFNREFKFLKKRYYQTKNLKIWNFSSVKDKKNYLFSDVNSQTMKREKGRAWGNGR